MLADLKDCKFISADALSEPEGKIVDVRSPEAFEESHIPGSFNHCVYEVAFVEAFPAAHPERDAHYVIYGEGAPFKADLAALGRLQALGYTNVSILEGGFKRWRDDGRPAEETGNTVPDPPAGHYILDVEKTRIRWIGRNLINQHDGEVGVAGGSLELGEGGMPLSGKVIADLTLMTNRDLQDASLSGALIAHLQNTDFFDVKTFPQATFTMKSAKPIAGASYGQPNYHVEGILNARGTDSPIELDALIEPIPGGYVFQANFDFDRVAHGAVYGSGKLFERLGMHLVNDLVSIDVIAFFKYSSQSKKQTTKHL